MVIAGVYLGPIIDDQLVLLLDISCFFSLAYSISLSITLLFSLLSAISVSDVKSIIASPTVSQLSYMFLALVINPILSLLIY
jgi:NADH:ubiquinone oxidoreductase subunit 5 (subunit L)/multisubunit Na+/H+ antiporter MnhA subunit